MEPLFCRVVRPASAPRDSPRGAAARAPGASQEAPRRPAGVLFRRQSDAALVQQLCDGDVRLCGRSRRERRQAGHAERPAHVRSQAVVWLWRRRGGGGRDRFPALYGFRRQHGPVAGWLARGPALGLRSTIGQSEPTWPSSGHCRRPSAFVSSGFSTLQHSLPSALPPSQVDQPAGADDGGPADSTPTTFQIGGRPTSSRFIIA